MRVKITRNVPHAWTSIGRETGDGTRSLELRDVSLNKFVEDEQGPVVHGPELLILSLFPPCAAPQSFSHSRLLSTPMKALVFACPQGYWTRRGEISALFPSFHTCLHVRNLVLARAHVGENCLPLEAANVLGSGWSSR
jgi:hypothetical protein